MRIVIAEDEKITRQWIERQIGRLGADCRVTGSFPNGRQALDYLSKEGADVLFTDIRMPVMDGMELLEALQSSESGPYKVILSAYDEFQYAQQALRLGAHEFTLKPEITGEEIARILEDARVFQRKQNRAPEMTVTARERQELWMRGVLGVSREVHEEEIARGLREHGIGLGEKNLAAISISVKEAAPRKKVMELLQLVLEEEEAGCFCFQAETGEYVLFLNRGTMEKVLECADRLWQILCIHTGAEVYVGTSTLQSGYGKLWRLYRQAAAADRNRRFYGRSGYIKYEDLRMKPEDSREGLEAGGTFDGRCRPAESGAARNGPSDRVRSGSAEHGPNGARCPDFGELLLRIPEALEQRAFDRALELADVFFDAAAEMDYLHPAFVVAHGREILTGYIRRLRAYTLDDGECAYLARCELLLGRPPARFEEFRREAREAIRFLSESLARREGGGSYSPAVCSIMQYVEEHYAERISLEQVANAAFLSRSYASVLFKRETGEKFSDYLQGVRLKKSCGLLKDTGLSVQEVADQTGFFDTAHFGRVFKEKMGVTPLEYRRANSGTKKVK